MYYIETVASCAIHDAQRFVDKHQAAMQSSAELCLADAKALAMKGEWNWALLRAIHSMEYTVGVLSEAHHYYQTWYNENVK